MPLLLGNLFEPHMTYVTDREGLQSLGYPQPAHLLVVIFTVAVWTLLLSLHFLRCPPSPALGAGVLGQENSLDCLTPLSISPTPPFLSPDTCPGC